MNVKKQNRHNYEYDFSLDSNTAGAEVLKMVGQGKRVLEIGAGPGSITKYLVDPGECQVTALEIDPEAIKKLSTYCQQIYEADLNDVHWPELLDQEERFKVVIAADVLEHLYDPWTTLKLMKGLIDNNGYLVVSLPNIGHSAIIACLLNKDFEYRDWGLLDRTHIRFFGLKNIQMLFESAGLKILEAQFIIKQPGETEFIDQWNKLSRQMKHELLSCQFNQVYQVVIKAVPEEREGESIDLMSMSIELPAKINREIFRAIVRTVVPSGIRMKLRQVALLLKGQSNDR